MAISCRNYGQIDPFDERNLNVVKGGREVPEARPEVEAIKERVEEIKIPEVVSKMTQEIDRLYAEGQWDIQDVDDFKRALTALEEIKTLGVDSPEYKTVLKQFQDSFYEDLHLDISEVTALHESVARSRELLEERLALREGHLDRTKAPIYLMSPAGERVKPGQEDIIKAGTHWSVDFGGNEAAEARVGLIDMMPDEIQHLIVTTRTGQQKEGHRAENGNFYRNPKTLEGKIYVFTGYTVEIPSDAEETVDEDAVADTVFEADQEGEETVQAQALEGILSSRDEVLREDAAERIARSKAASAERHRDTLALAEGLKRNDRERIPDDFKGTTAFEYSETLAHLDLGDQVMKSLDTLAQIGGAPNEIDMWERIRRKQLRKDTVSFGEICRATLGLSIDKTMEKYDKLRRQVEIIDIADEIIEQEKEIWLRDHESLEGFNERHVFKMIRDTLKEYPEWETYVVNFYEITEYTVGDMRDERERFRQELEQMEDFLVASYSLLDAVPKLKPRARVEYTIDREISPERAQAEYLVASIFDRDDQGPPLKRSLLRRLLKRKEKGQTVNMDLYMETYKYRDEIDMYMSSAAAYTQLLHSSIEMEGREERVNPERLMERLNDLRAKGLMASAFDAEVMDQIDHDPDKYLETPLATDLLENPDSLSELDRQLIRRGMMFEQGTKFIDQKQEDIEYLKANSLPMTAAAIDAIAKEGQHTTDQLEDIADALDQHYLLTAGVMLKRWERITSEEQESGEWEITEEERGMELGFGLDVPVELPHGVTLHGGFDQNVFTGRFEIHAGVGGTIGREGSRTRLRLAGGAQKSGTELRVGVGAEFQVDLGRYQEHSIGIGAFAGATVSEKAFVGAVLSAGYTRNLEGILIKKREKLEEGQRADMDFAMSKYESDLVDMGLSETQIQEYKDHLEDYFQRLLLDGAIDNMKDVQFLGVGVALVIPPQPRLKPPVYLKMAIKGKKHIVYSKPAISDMGRLTDRALERAIERQEGTASMNPVFISGDIMINNNGLRTISESFEVDEMWTKKLEEVNTSLAPHGLELVPVETEEGRKRIRLDASRVDGVVDIFAADDVGIQIYPEDGQVFINLDEADDLSIRRADEYYPFRKDGFLQHTKIYISNNIHDPGSRIESSTSQHIQYTEHVGETTKFITRAEVVTRRGVEEVAGVFDSEEAMLDAGITLGDMLADVESLKEAREAMDSAIGKRPEAPLNEADREELRDIAAELVRNNKITYRQLSTLEIGKKEKRIDYERIVEMVKAAYPDRDFSNEELTFLNQAMMIETITAAPEDKKLVEFITGWNQSTLAAGLQEHGKDLGMTKGMSESIARKIMKEYERQVVKALAAGETLEDALITEGSTVHVQVGSMRIKGYRESFYDPSEGLGIVGLNTIDRTNLIDNFGLTEKEADLFIATVTEQLSPLPEAPAELFRTQLGLAVLDASEVLFGSEMTLKLAEIVNRPELATQAEYAEIYKEYADIVRRLRAEGSLTYKGMLLEVATEKHMGFYEACRNFTMTMHERLKISIPESQTTAVSAEVFQHMRGRPGVEFWGVGVAAVVGGEREEEEIRREEEVTEPSEKEKQVAQVTEKPTTRPTPEDTEGEAEVTY